MRIIFVNSIFPNPVEPGKGIFIQKNLALYPKEYDIDVIAPVAFFLGFRRRKKASIPFMRHEAIGDRKIRIWHPRFALFPRNILRALVPSFEYYSMLPIVWFLNRKKKVDCLHANFCIPDGVATFRLSRTLGIPYVITEHQGIVVDLMNKKYLRLMMLPAYNTAHKVIAVSERTAKSIIEAGVPRNKVITVPNGIDPDLFWSNNERRPIKRLIYVGNLIYSKGVHVLIESISMLKEEDLSLSIVGDGIYRKKLEILVANYGLQSKINFMGTLSPLELAKELRDHDALVHPSFVESFGLVVVEAMAAGLPVLATRNGGSEEIVTPDTGILVAINDAKALADGILKLRSEKWDRNFISFYARDNYDIAEVVKKTIAQYPTKKHEYSVCHMSSVHVRTDVRIFYKQCASLHKAGFKVHLIVADSKRHERKNGIIIHDAGASSSRLGRILSAPFRVLRKAFFINADAYQIHDPELLPIAILLKLITRKPVIYDVHESYSDFILHKDYLSKTQRFILSNAIYVIEKIALKVLDTGIAATEHISEQLGELPIIHNYPLLTEWNSIPEDDSRFESRNICYIGSITEERGIKTLIEAIEDIDCTFHLAGSYEPATYRDELLKLPGFSKVVEHGYVDREKSAQIMGESALGIVLLAHKPNNFYSLSTKMFEYMASGLPLMVSDLPLNVKMLDTSQAGIYLDPQNIEMIKERLSSLLDDPKLLSQMGKKGKALVQDDLSWEAEEERYVQIYSDLLKMEIN